MHARGSHGGAGKNKVEGCLSMVQGLVRNTAWLGQKWSSKHTGSQQHELDKKADTSGRMVEVRPRRRVKRLSSVGLEIGLGSLSPEGGQLLHDMVKNQIEMDEFQYFSSWYCLVIIYISINAPFLRNDARYEAHAKPSVNCSSYVKQGCIISVYSLQVLFP